MDGVIVVDKPSGWTSHDVVGKMRRIAATKRVGHLGTLDPMATGVLPLVLNRATRLSQFLMKADKKYEAVVRFGFATDTYDADGERVGPEVPVNIRLESVRELLGSFAGEIDQVPPPVSAKKINGVPAYKLVRQDKPVNLNAVRVSVRSLEATACNGTDVTLLIHCSSGTYVRRIAHDLGERMGCGAHLAALRRTEAGLFRIEQARTLPQLEEMAKAARLEEALIPPSELLPEFPIERVDGPTAGFIRQGRDFRVSPFRVRSGAKFVKAIGEDGALVAIGQMVLPNLYHPTLVL